MAKVSVVVPVYNAAKYIEVAMRSLIEQTYQDCELIFVNDGSKDDSSSIINRVIQEQREKGNFNIKYIYQRNAGVGSARNTGMNVATGKYITFMDSDDYVEPFFISDHMEVIQSNPYSIIGGYFIKIKEGPVKDKRIAEEKIKFMSNPSACFRLFDLDFIRQNELSFRDYKVGEDLNFCGKVQLLNPEYRITSRPSYHYFIRGGSLSDTTDRSQFDLLDAVTDLENFAKANDLFEQNEAELGWMVIKHILMAGVKRAAEGNLLEEAINRIIDYVYKAHPDWYNNPYIAKYADDAETEYIKAVFNGNRDGIRRYASNHW